VDNTAGNGQGWPCRDGTGMGMDATSGCDSYTVSGNLTGAGCPQNVEPLYTWNNSGTNGTFTTAESAGVSQAVQNTDYFVDNLGGNNSAATNSTGAIYWGANSAKGTCTYGSAPYAYFTTDTRSLYRCNANSTWGDGAGNSTPYYTELACPNPLTGLTGSCNNSMAGVGGYPSGSPGVSSTGQVTGNMSR